MGSLADGLSNEKILAAVALALQLEIVLVLSHLVFVPYICYEDLYTDDWERYSLEKKRTATLKDYADGVKSFFVDIFICNTPFLSLSLYFSYDRIAYSTDPLWVSTIKFLLGYNLGRVWAYGMHRLLHTPYFYSRFHKRHHVTPAKLVASGAWLDSYFEYLFMELPSFLTMILFFPTNILFHQVFFVWHGVSAAADHSGFAFPEEEGWLRNFLFDGEVHYMHHKLTTWNYGEVEWIDYLFKTHHTQRPQHAAKRQFNRQKRITRRN